MLEIKETIYLCPKCKLEFKDKCPKCGKLPPKKTAVAWIYDHKDLRDMEEMSWNERFD